MFDILYCIQNEHDYRLVLLAALVCTLSSLTAVLMVRQAVQSKSGARRAWLLAGGLSTGFGIWSTHFIAMLGYDPGIIAGYHPLLTISSLAMVLATTLIAFRIVISNRTWPAQAAAALVAGSGFAAMHYTGMAALQMPAIFRWNNGYVALSVILAIVPLAPALALVANRRSLASGLGAAALMVLAIVGLHFTGMTAIRLIPAPIEQGALIFSPRVMSGLITAVSLILLGLCVSGWIVARRTGTAIAASQRQFSILVKGISDCAIYMLDTSGRVANWNTGAQRLKGYRQDEAVGLELATFYTPEDRALDAPARAVRAARESGKFTGEGWRLRKDGTRFWAHVTIERIHDDSGDHIGFAKITRDMTRFKQDQDRILEARQHLDAALEHMHQGLCLYDADGRLVMRNQRFLDLWQLPPESCPPGTDLNQVVRTALEARTGAAVPDERMAGVHRILAEALDNPNQPPHISEFGEQFIVSISNRPMPDGGWVTTYEDITEHRRSEARIAHLAHNDGLTGLPNRASFSRWLDREIEQADLRRRQIALVVIDLDRFKDVNDNLGHAAGDKVLRQLAVQLDGIAVEGEMAARLGADEFAIARQFSHDHELREFVSRVEAALQPAANLVAEGTDAPMPPASLGVAVYPEDAASCELLINNADLAMQRAKLDPAQMLCFYERGMDELARRRRQLGNDLRHAVQRGELSILFQEQRLLSTRALSGYEALLRWNHPVFGTVSPVEFIPIAEETGEIIKIGEWVLRTACAEAARWGPALTLAVNLSPVQLLRRDLPEQVTEALVFSGLSPRRLELEITESAIIEDKQAALNSLRRIKALGVSVAMDDFGTGYSSLDTLHSFPFDKIKIDKSFLLQSDESEQARTIISSVVALGRNLGIPVLAEGVESEGHLALLEKEGCAEAQGFYFGRPGPAPSTIGLQQAAG